VDWTVVMIEGQAEPVNLHRNDLLATTRDGDHLQIELTDRKLMSVRIDETAKQEGDRAHQSQNGLPSTRRPFGWFGMTYEASDWLL
jgi:hypothetical protein